MSRQDIKTEYGTIHVSSPGPYDKYDNVNVYKQTDQRHVVLQGPALRAFKAAELRITPKRMKRKGKVRHILITGVGYRDYDLQRQLWLSDPGRFANPDYSMHVEALAVDIDQGQSAARLYAIRKALLLEGWHYAVPNEPWHTSFTVSG